VRCLALAVLRQHVAVAVAVALTLVALALRVVTLALTPVTLSTSHCRLNAVEIVAHLCRIHIIVTVWSAGHSEREGLHEGSVWRAFQSYAAVSVNTQHDSDVISFHLYASWFSASSCG